MINDDQITDADVEAALRLTREYIYGGGEPYAPEVHTFAKLLAAHRIEGRLFTSAQFEAMRRQADDYKVGHEDVTRKLDELCGAIDSLAEEWRNGADLVRAECGLDLADLLEATCIADIDKAR